MKNIKTEDLWENQDFLRIHEVEKQINKKQKRDRTVGFGPNIKNAFGICYACRAFHFIENDAHQIIVSKCSAFDIKLGQHKVKTCSNFRKRGAMDIEDMYRIATLIDLDNKKQIGILSKGD